MVASLRTRRLTLEPLEVAHSDVMVAVLAHPALYRFTGGEPPSPEELAARYERQTSGSATLKESWHNWIVFLDGAAVDYVQATVDTGSGTAALAWLVAPPAQGLGIAREAAAAVMSRLTDTGAARVFTANIVEGHVASERVASGLGMKPSGLFHDGERVWSSPPSATRPQGR